MAERVSNHSFTENNSPDNLARIEAIGRVDRTSDAFLQDTYKNVYGETYNTDKHD